MQQEKGRFDSIIWEIKKVACFYRSLSQYNATWAKLQTLSFTGLNTKLLKHPNAENLYFKFIKEQNYFFTEHSTMKKQTLLYLQFLNNNKKIQETQVIPAFIEIISPALTDCITFHFLKYKCARRAHWSLFEPGEVQQSGEGGSRRGCRTPLCSVLWGVSPRFSTLFMVPLLLWSLPDSHCCLLPSSLQLGTP